MVWQDMMIFGGNALFTYAILNQAYQGFKKRKGFLTIQTSLLTSIGLFAIAIATYTLNLPLSATIITFNATIWFILFLQRITYGEA